ncbi:MAG: 50S ribosomal protein L22 [Spirochaetes bacterium]|nr:50S ribosomal protein L22 [Spirochaetota bacterium]
MNLVRNKGLMDSINMLKLINIANKRYLLKLLESVMANAKIKNPDVDLKTLFITKAIVDEGPRIKRMMPRARGRADVILKRMSHINIEIEMPEKIEANDKKVKAKAKVKTKTKAESKIKAKAKSKGKK